MLARAESAPARRSSALGGVGAGLWAERVFRGFMLTVIFPSPGPTILALEMKGEKLVILAQVKLKPVFLSVIAQVGKLVFCCLNKWSGRRTCNVERR